MENLPASSGPLKEPKDETVAGNRSDVLEALEKAFAKLTSTSDLQALIDLHSRMRVVVSVEKRVELKGHIVQKLFVVLGVVKPTSILQGMLELKLT